MYFAEHQTEDSVGGFVQRTREIEEAFERWDTLVAHQCSFQENELHRLIAWAAIGVEEFGDAAMEGDEQ